MARRAPGVRDELIRSRCRSTLTSTDQLPGNSKVNTKSVVATLAVRLDHSTYPWTEPQRNSVAVSLPTSLLSRLSLRHNGFEHTTSVFEGQKRHTYSLECRQPPKASQSFLVWPKLQGVTKRIPSLTVVTSTHCVRLGHPACPDHPIHSSMMSTLVEFHIWTRQPHGAA